MSIKCVRAHLSGNKKCSSFISYYYAGLKSSHIGYLMASFSVLYLQNKQFSIFISARFVNLSLKKLGIFEGLM